MKMRTVIITGSGSGIGREVAILMSKLKQFENIALIGRNRAGISETVSAMDCCGVNVEIFERDLSDFAHAGEVISEIYSKFNSIDCLINIAGYTDPQPTVLTTAENLKETYSVNVFSPFMLIRESVRYMKRTGGKILNVASTAGMTPRPGWISYSSSKAAVISMSQTLSEELAEYGIKVYCVSPGRCATKLRKKLAPNEDPSTIMQPEEVAEIICRLVSEDENCLDGQNIVIRKQIAVKTVGGGMNV